MCSPARYICRYIGRLNINILCQFNTLTGWLSARRSVLFTEWSCHCKLGLISRGEKMEMMPTILIFNPPSVLSLTVSLFVIIVFTWNYLSWLAPFLTEWGSAEVVLGCIRRRMRKALLVLAGGRPWCWRSQNSFYPETNNYAQPTWPGMAWPGLASQKM